MYICKSINIHLKKYWHIQQKICIYIYISVYNLCCPETPGAFAFSTSGPGQDMLWTRDTKSTPGFEASFNGTHIEGIKLDANSMVILREFFWGSCPFKRRIFAGLVLQESLAAINHPPIHPSIIEEDMLHPRPDPEPLASQWSAKRHKVSAFQTTSAMSHRSMPVPKRNIKKNTTKTFQTTVTVSFGQSSES